MPPPTLNSEEPVTRLDYIAQTHLHLSRVEVGLMVFGELLDFIDDIIPAGI